MNNHRQFKENMSSSSQRYLEEAAKVEQELKDIIERSKRAGAEAAPRKVDLVALIKKKEKIMPSLPPPVPGERWSEVEDNVSRVDSSFRKVILESTKGKARSLEMYKAALSLQRALVAVSRSAGIPSTQILHPDADRSLSVEDREELVLKSIGSAHDLVLLLGTLLAESHRRERETLHRLRVLNSFAAQGILGQSTVSTLTDVASPSNYEDYTLLLKALREGIQIEDVSSEILSESASVSPVGEVTIMRKSDDSGPSQ